MWTVVVQTMYWNIFMKSASCYQYSAVVVGIRLVRENLSSCFSYRYLSVCCDTFEAVTIIKSVCTEYAHMTRSIFGKEDIFFSLSLGNVFHFCVRNRIRICMCRCASFLVRNDTGFRLDCEKQKLCVCVCEIYDVRRI